MKVSDIQAEPATATLVDSDGDNLEATLHEWMGDQVILFDPGALPGEAGYQPFIYVSFDEYELQTLRKLVNIDPVALRADFERDGKWADHADLLLDKLGLLDENAPQVASAAPAKASKAPAKAVLSVVKSLLHHSISQTRGYHDLTSSEKEIVGSVEMYEQLRELAGLPPYTTDFDPKDLQPGDMVRAVAIDRDVANVPPSTFGVVFQAARGKFGPAVRWSNGVTCNVYKGMVDYEG